MDGISGSSFGGKSVSFVLNSEGFNNFNDAGIYMNDRVTCSVWDVEF